nr:hypothetical protein [Tanacetum cinerariifolium]
MLMANGEECLDDWVGAGGGEVKGGGVNFRVILLGEIPEESTGESGGEDFRVEGGVVWRVTEEYAFGRLRVEFSEIIFSIENKELAIKDFEIF